MNEENVTGYAASTYGRGKFTPFELLCIVTAARKAMGAKPDHARGVTHTEDDEECRCLGWELTYQADRLRGEALDTRLTPRKYGFGYESSYELTDNPLAKWTGNVECPSFNDRCETKAEVLAMLDKCIADLTAELAPPKPAKKPRAIKPGTKRYWANVLRRAAKLIETHGHVKGSMGSDERGFCAVGAMHKAASEQCSQWTFWDLAKASVAGGAIRASLNAIGVSQPLWGFNDDTEVTPKMVCRVLRQSAARLEHGGYVSSKRKAKVAA